MGNLDKNGDGCVDEEESLIALLQKGKCQISFAAQGKNWGEKDSLPTRLEKRYSVNLGIYTKKHCTNILGATWIRLDSSDNDNQDASSSSNNNNNCITGGILTKNTTALRKTLQNILDDSLSLFGISKTHTSSLFSPLSLRKEEEEKDSDITYNTFSAFHAHIADKYDIQDLTPRFQVPSNFKDVKECVYVSPVPKMMGLKNVSANSKEEDRIPDIVHQSWKSRSMIPDFAMDWISSWPRLNPSIKYIFWDDKDNDVLISKRFPMFLPAYRMMKPVEKADFARYVYLYEFGGVYADMDSECVQSVDKLSKRYAFIGQEPLFHALLLEHRENQFASNALMGSRPKHPFWLFMLTGIAVGDGSGDPVTKTGPRRISMMHDNFFKNGTGEALHGLVEIMPEEYFMPEPAWWNIDAMQRTCDDAEYEPNPEITINVCKDLNHRFSRKDDKKLYGTNTFAVHNWRCTWCRGTGTEIFKDITEIPIMKKRCLRPRIEIDRADWISCSSDL
mmetsp:Transcript_41089/g.66081  ORF Transcript_41089/g.66081 Transcript_41089/m.66081 type:complete len:504 (-) Transcript_41089:342-1853(-)